MSRIHARIMCDAFDAPGTVFGGEYMEISMNLPDGKFIGVKRLPGAKRFKFSIGDVGIDPSLPLSREVFLEEADIIQLTEMLKAMAQEKG